MGRSPIYKKAMTSAQRQRRYRKRLARKKALENPRLKQKQQRRAQREAELGAKQLALPDKHYGVIVADPEWRFEPWSRLTGMDRAADNHYPTSCTEIIAARPVESIAAKDCVLFLWATVPMLPHAILVMGAWGFDYRSDFAWAKDKAGTGYWNRNQHELLLIGRKGRKVPCPAPGENCGSWISAPVGEPSAKPECFLEMIEQFYPSLPKIELNCRGAPRPGWDAWGTQSRRTAFRRLMEQWTRATLKLARRSRRQERRDGEAKARRL